MSSKTVVSRTYPRTPYAAFGKNGGSLDLDDVLNGIAFKGENMLVTGKKWDKIYEVKIK